MNQYTFFWLDGRRDVYLGHSPADALNNAGYGAGALAALDFYNHGDSNQYWWDTTHKRWRNKELYPPPSLK